jgi:phage-related protein
MKGIRFLGSSLADLRSFPVVARHRAGFQLHQIQRGLMPSDWKPMTVVGPGVIEIRIRSAEGAFRVVYMTNFGDQVVVLHCFQKKAQQTSPRDIALAVSRYKSFLRGDDD